MYTVTKIYTSTLHSTHIRAAPLLENLLVNIVDVGGPVVGSVYFSNHICHTHKGNTSLINHGLVNIMSHWIRNKTALVLVNLKRFFDKIVLETFLVIIMLVNNDALRML